MFCPKCETVALTGATVSSVAVDRCPRCAGVWLDSGELDKLSTLNWVEVRPVAGGRLDPDLNRKRACCPRDQSALLRVYSARNKSLILDRCGQCGGVWLDGGELGRLLGNRQ